jgi:hypothetical protein
MSLRHVRCKRHPALHQPDTSLSRAETTETLNQQAPILLCLRFLPAPHMPCVQQMTPPVSPWFTRSWTDLIHLCLVACRVIEALNEQAPARQRLAGLVVLDLTDGLGGWHRCRAYARANKQQMDRCMGERKAFLALHWPSSLKHQSVCPSSLKHNCVTFITQTSV